MSEPGWESVAEDDWIVVLSKVEAGWEWFTWQCKDCGHRPNGSGSGSDRDSLIEESFWMGWWHVAGVMGGSSDWAYVAGRIEREYLAEEGLDW